MRAERTRLPEGDHVVDIVIVSFNTRDLLRECLASIEAHAPELGRPVRVIVADNASSDGSPAMVRDEFPGVTLVPLDENLGFGAGNNRGAAAGNAPLILFLNSDAQLTPGALPRLVECLEADPRRTAVGPRLEYPDGRFQPSCRRFPTPLRDAWRTSGLLARMPERFPRLHTWLTEAEHAREQRVDMVSGACFLMRRDCFRTVGGFDENLFLYEEEMDIFLPAYRRGLELWYCPQARIIHNHGGSVTAGNLSDFSRFHRYRSKYVCFRKHYGPWGARATYGLDLAIFEFQALRRRLRGQGRAARLEARVCRHAWRLSHVPAAELRAHPDAWRVPG